MHHELAGRALKNSLQHVARQLAFGLFRRQACLIDVGTLGFVSADSPFCSHDLQEFQDAGVAQVLRLAQRLVNFAHRGGAARPQNTQNFQLCSGRLLWRRLHDDVPYYEDIRSVNENLRSRMARNLR